MLGEGQGLSVWMHKRATSVGKRRGGLGEGGWFWRSLGSVSARRQGRRERGEKE